jgi:hypothetical protein
MEKLLEEVFSLLSVPGLYIEDQLSVRDNKIYLNLAVVKVTTVQVTKVPL